MRGDCSSGSLCRTRPSQLWWRWPAHGTCWPTLPCSPSARLRCVARIVGACSNARRLQAQRCVRRQRVLAETKRCSGSRARLCAGAAVVTLVALRHAVQLVRRRLPLVVRSKKRTRGLTPARRCSECAPCVSSASSACAAGAAATAGRRPTRRAAQGDGVRGGAVGTQLVTSAHHRLVRRRGLGTPAVARASARCPDACRGSQPAAERLQREPASPANAPAHWTRMASPRVLVARSQALPSNSPRRAVLPPEAASPGWFGAMEQRRQREQQEGDMQQRMWSREPAGGVGAAAAPALAASAASAALAERVQSAAPARLQRPSSAAAVPMRNAPSRQGSAARLRPTSAASTAARAPAQPTQAATAAPAKGAAASGGGERPPSPRRLVPSYARPTASSASPASWPSVCWCAHPCVRAGRSALLKQAARASDYSAELRSVDRILEDLWADPDKFIGGQR